MSKTDSAATINMQHALQDPAAVFVKPEAVVAHGGLTAEQKIEILRRWAYDAAEEAVAGEEGMPDGSENLEHHILLALDELTGGVDVEHVGPTKHHGLSARSARSK